MTQLAPWSNGYLTVSDPYSETIRNCGACGEDYRWPNGQCACPDEEERWN